MGGNQTPLFILCANVQSKIYSCLSPDIRPRQATRGLSPGYIHKGGFSSGYLIFTLLVGEFSLLVMQLHCMAHSGGRGWGC